MRVVFVVVDALPCRWVTADTTPAIRALGAEGAIAPDGWRSVLSSNTYPNHATFVTGVGPEHHHMWINQVVVDGAPRPAAEVGPRVPTLFGRCAEAGRTSAFVAGDQNLVGVMGARSADVHWPPEGRIPEGVERSAFGYSRDYEVLAAIDRVGAVDADLVVIQFDETDTMAHLHGPDGEGAVEQYGFTDRAVGVLIDQLRPRWGDTVMIVVSDHEQELVTDPEPVTLAAALEGDDVTVVEEGAVALVVGAVEPGAVASVDGVGEVQPVPDGLLAYAEPGRMIAPASYPLLGVHGSPRTATQVAVVGGGHPRVADVAEVVAGAPRSATAWAGVVADLLEI